jgi:para-aminobenzoate synthetase/4-amino-4-deoxychorismate lyase
VPDLKQAPLVLLDDSRPAHRAGRSLLFSRPEEIIPATTLSEVPDALAALDAAYAQGLNLAGWIAYECAAHFEPRLATHITRMPEEPLIWMIATRNRQVLNSTQVTSALHAARRGNHRQASLEVGASAVRRADYLAAVEQVHAFIRAGDVYQINYTFPLPCTLEGDPLALYETLRHSQPVPYGAYIDTGAAAPSAEASGRGAASGWKLLSLSPELFLRRRGNRLHARPMKGTAPRGASSEADGAVMRDLALDEKSRAENLMIVDLIRNDLSRLARPGSVRVGSLFEVERYKSLHQMTSSVQADVTGDLAPSALLAALFPCGSVTGAPKVRAMEIIAALEQQPRGVYCGAIGHFSPPEGGQGADWSLNVPIRTLVMGASARGRLSVGSGVVADSRAEGEYDECLLKARFAEGADAPPFSLIETLRLEEDGKLPRLERHIARLQNSARYFDFAFDARRIREALSDHCNALGAGHGRRRIRLLLDQAGAVSVTSLPLAPPSAQEGKVCFAAERVLSSDPFLFHKTTRRGLYDRAIAKAHSVGFDDMLFFNERDELTEGAISSVFVVRGGKWFTPPLTAGLLPGVLREELLEASLPGITERTIRRADVLSADALYIGNSLRGLRRVSLLQTEL